LNHALKSIHQFFAKTKESDRRLRLLLVAVKPVGNLMFVLPIESAQGQHVTEFERGSGQKGQGRVGALNSIRAPSLAFIEATGPQISAKHPEHGLTIAILVEKFSGSCQEKMPNTASHEIWGDEKKMELSRILCCYLFRIVGCANLHEADYLALVFGYKEALLFCWRNCQFLYPERLQAVEQARVDWGLGHDILIGALC